MSDEERASAASEATPGEAYAEKTASRLERLRVRAARLKAQAERRIDKARQMASVIPFGQPILVGHHSEGRDRNYRGRIDAGFTKGFADLKEAQELERRAEAAEKNAERVVSSDDPDAVSKLKRKLEEVESLRVSGRAINKIIQAARRKHSPTEWGFAAAADLLKAGHSEKLVNVLLTADFAGRYGMPDYKLANLGAEARRLAIRIKSLEEAREMPEPVVVATENGEEIKIEEYPGDNRIRIVFPGKPSDEARKLLKSRGFKWSPTAGAWQRQTTNAARYDAKDVVRIVTERKL
jgi:hypothetical protein